MFALFSLGGGEIILILALVLILFGAKKLPELARGLGTGIKEFKKATQGAASEVSAAFETPAPARTLPVVSAAESQPRQSIAQPTVESKNS